MEFLPIDPATLTADYIHIVINHLPIEGLMAGAFALAIALLIKSAAARGVALATILFMSLSAIPVYSFGDKAYDRVSARSDDDGEAWLDEHLARAQKGIYCYYVLAALALVALVAPRKFPKSALPLAVVVLMGAGAVIGVGGWIAYAGGKVTHKEFRHEPPPIQAKE